MPNAIECDVLVIGGGPAGSTAAALLAEAGRDVLLVEKSAHPRFHIGESLLPRNAAILKRLGMLDAVQAMGVHKPGAEFVSDRTGRSTAFAFRHALNPAYTHAWQVQRAEFDAALFANAAHRGARTMERTRLASVRFAPNGRRAEATAIGPGGEVLIRPRFVLDASGRDTFLAGKLRLKDTDKRNSTAAVYGHFRGVERRAGELEGYISIHLAEDGWFWLIPLPANVMSVGFVANQATLKGRLGRPRELFMDRIAASPTVSARMAAAELASEVVSTGNYSYRARRGHGDGFLMIGDAYGFVDPMFSTGVLMAMTAGELGAEAADAWLDDPRRGRALCARAARDLTRGMDRINWLIYRMNDPVLRSLFMEPRNALGMRDGLINLLAGNLRGEWRTALPVLAFKTVYRATSLLHRAGLGPAVPETYPATASG